MNSRRFWLKILNVYAEEWWIVKRLYMLQFLQGAGIAFFFTSAFAQFLDKFDITKLPWVMIWSAGLLWITGFLYAKLEHVLSFRQFNVGSLFFTTITMLLCWIINHNTAGDWFVYMMMAWFYVLYMVDNLGFWGIAALLFDVRQSKRLFAVISAGDIPAKFIGYTLALLIVPYTGTQNLMLIGAGFTLVSLPFLLSIIKSGKHEAHQSKNSHHHHEQRHKPRKIGKLVSNIVTNTYIRRIAVISLITSCCVILFNYGLYGEVAKAYHEDIELATFIAIFYASIRILAFITKMIFTSRLTLRLGVKSALFITPVGMVMLIAMIIMVGTLSDNHKLVFYLFGISSIVVEVLRTSFNTPVLLTLMQPLPIGERLRAHNIVKGVMDPFASFLAGIVLLFFYYLGQNADIIFLCYGLLGLGALWVGGVVLVNRRYVSILIKTISSRYFSRDEFDLNDEVVMAQIKKRMMKGSELEVISILNMLNSKKIDKVAEELILELLHHPSDRIKVEAIHVIANRNFTNANESLVKLFSNGVPDSVKTEAIKTFCRIGSNESAITKYIHHDNEEIRYAAITGMLLNPHHAIQQNAETEVTNILTSHSASDKKKGISILNEVKNFYSHPLHGALIEDPDETISELSIKAIGRSASAKTLRMLLNQVGTHEKHVLEALYEAGEKSVVLIEEQLQGGFVNPRLQNKLIVLLGKIGGEHAIRVLLSLLRKGRYTEAIIRALHRCRYSITDETQKEFEALTRTYIAYGVELLHMQQALSKNAHDYDVLHNSLYYEIQNIREILLFLFGCMYDREKMNQVKYGLSARGVESTANAMEIIELTVRKDIGRLFNTLFEGTSVEQRCESLRALLVEGEFNQVNQVLTRILSEKPIDYYNWTKACSLYFSKKYDHFIDVSLFEKFVASDNMLLKETALFADSKILT
jgi:ATP:ADP antiporter, AAA family